MTTADSPWRIRPAVDSDGDGIAALIDRVFSEYEGCPFDAAEFPELRHPASHYVNRNGRLWVVVADDGEICGTIAISSPDGDGVFELNKVYLDRRLRGTGLGRELYGIATQHACSQGAKALKLWTDTRFLSGHRFYEKLGFSRQPVVRYLADSTNAWEFSYRLDLAQ